MQGMPGDMNELSILMSFKMMGNTMTDCFGECITDFRSGDLSNNEKVCLKNCSSRSFETFKVLQ